MNDQQSTVSRIFATLQAAWNDGSGASFGAPFAEDADFVDIRGEHHRCRAAIAHGHQAIFDSIYKGSTICYEVTAVRPLSDGTVLAHVVGTLAAPSGPLAGTSRCTISAVLARTGEDWEISAFHNTLCAT